LFAIGRGLGLVEEWGLAEKAFEKAVSADGKYAEAWAWLGEASQQNGQDGGADLSQALALDPQDAIVHALRGHVNRRRHQLPGRYHPVELGKGVESRLLLQIVREGQREDAQHGGRKTLDEVHQGPLRKVHQGRHSVFPPSCRSRNSW
jgi:hypothetical protein